MENEIRKHLEEDLKKFPKFSSEPPALRTGVSSGGNPTSIASIPEYSMAETSAKGGIQLQHPLHLMTMVAEQCNWVDLANNVIAAACASTTPLWRLSTTLSAKYKTDKRQKDMDALTDKLMFPNIHQSGYQLSFQTYYDLNLYGNAYWQVIFDRKGDIHSIYTLPPETIRVVPFIKDNEIHFMYVQMATSLNKNPRVFEESEIIHFKRPNAKSFIYGKPLYFSQLLQVAASINSKKAITSWFESGYSGGAIFKMDPDASVADRNRAVLNDLYTKPENFGAILLLEGGIELVADGNKFKDFDFSGLSNADRDNILFSAGVPISMAGVRSAAGNANAEIVASEEMAFNLITVGNNHKLVCGTLNNKLFRQILSWNDVTVEPGVLTKFSMKNAIDIVNALAVFGIGVNEARDLLATPRVPSEEAGKVYLIKTNNGAFPADRVVGINYETGEEVETIFDQEQAQNLAKGLGDGASGMGGDVKDKAESGKKPKKEDKKE